MATIKTLLGNVKGKDGRGCEEVVLYSGTCSACISSNVATSTSPMIEMSESIENYSSIRIEFQYFDGTSSGEGTASTSRTFSTEFIKKVYTHSSLVSTTTYGNVSAAQIFGFYDATHLVLMWELYTGIAHNVSYITVTGIKNTMPDAEKNFNKYSTTEEVVGTWIDGKPIYRKTFDNISVPSSEHSAIPIATGLTIDNLINISGYLVNGGRWIVTLNSADTKFANMARVAYDRQTSTLQLVAQNWAGTATVTIEYTKTTD